jgi:hypothetical protein
VDVIYSVMELHIENEAALVATAYALSGLALISDTAKAALSKQTKVLDLTVKTLRRLLSAELSMACCTCG